MSENKPFFSVVIPLYNKQSHVKETIESALTQTFQGFEIVIVNDGSTDDSVKIVESIKDNRIRVIHQENQGVSVARNRGIKEAKADYIAFLDADDLWLPDFLHTIYELIQKYPNVGLYTTEYKKRKANGEEINMHISGLPSIDYQGVIPNFFKSATIGNFPTWTSVVCIPKKIFFDNNIWFPIGEKYGEDLHVWARIAMLFNVVCSTKICALYMIEAENNTIEKSAKVKEPHKSILSLIEYRHLIKDNESLKYFNLFMKLWISKIIYFNIKNGDRIYAIKNFFRYKLTLKQRAKLVLFFLVPFKIHPFLKVIYKKLRELL